MKHNLTAEQIVYVMFALIGLFWAGYIYLDNLKKKYYRKGYADGWRRAKSTFGKGYFR